MSFKEKDANAQILRNYVDFSTKSNQYFTTHLSSTILEIFDSAECSGDALNKIEVSKGVQLLRRRFKALSNLDIAYVLILATRGFKFRLVTERIFLCEERAIFPNFERFPPLKPKLSDDYEIKSAILNSIIEGLDKDDEELMQEIIRSIPELLERASGVRYTGKFLSINEWLNQKEQEGSWISEEIFRFGNSNMTPWIMGNILILQARGWYLQEIPEKFKGSDFVFIKK
ncbi:MAG: hypothetical protein KGD64_10735 [Candidatus Heimdallarchaeota archaeon]|nr:hypothetical protein [Candidatus Heimdallarchaeota archaeon]